MLFKGSGCFQFPLDVFKESLRSTEWGSLQALAVMEEQKQSSTVVTNFGSEGKPMI